MSYFDQLLDSYTRIEEAKAAQPRAVQTVAQNQADQRTSVDSASATSAAAVGSSGFSFAGFDKRILYVTGAVIAGLFVLKMVKK